MKRDQLNCLQNLESHVKLQQPRRDEGSNWLARVEQMGQMLAS